MSRENCGIMLYEVTLPVVSPNVEGLICDAVVPLSMDLEGCEVARWLGWLSWLLALKEASEQRGGFEHGDSGIFQQTAV